MDQGSLVGEQIRQGAKFVHALGNYAPLSAAFWLKLSDEGQWYLYLTSPQIDYSNLKAAYAEVWRLLSPGPNPWLHPFQVKLVPNEDPVAREMVDIQQRYASEGDERVRVSMLGGSGVEDGYAYHLPVALPS